MRIQRGDHIRSEIGELEAMLARIPRGRVIARAGLEGRVARLRDELGRLPPEGKHFGLAVHDEPVDADQDADEDELLNGS